MVPPFFPLLLVVPAVVIDVLMRRIGPGRDWQLAAVLGVAFVAVLLAVEWFFADFMLTPAARNYFFAADQWEYNQPLGPWRYVFWGPTESAGTFAQGIGMAMLYAAISARIGLLWGNGMKRLKR